MDRPIVVVTGASTGIGRACALDLDRSGFQVVAGVRREADADSLRAAARGRLRTIRLDVTDSDQIAAAAVEVAALTGDRGLAGLVNNAGVAVSGPLEFIPPEQVRRQLDVNVVGQIAVTQAFLPQLRRAGGRIVFIGSVAGFFPQPFLAPYSASKHALEAVADALRVELAPWGVGVSLVRPGSVATPIWEKGSRAAETMVAAMPARAQELYGPALRRVQAIVAHEIDNAIPAERVADVVIHALRSPRPRTRYRIGRGTLGLVAARRLLSDRLRDRLILHLGRLPRRAESVGG